MGALAAATKKRGSKEQHSKRQVKMALEGLSDSLKVVKGEVFYEKVFFSSWFLVALPLMCFHCTRALVFMNDWTCHGNLSCHAGGCGGTGPTLIYPARDVPSQPRAISSLGCITYPTASLEMRHKFKFLVQCFPKRGLSLRQRQRWHLRGKESLARAAQLDVREGKWRAWLWAPALGPTLLTPLDSPKQRSLQGPFLQASAFPFNRFSRLPARLFEQKCLYLG